MTNKKSQNFFLKTFFLALFLFFDSQAIAAAGELGDPLRKDERGPARHIAASGVHVEITSEIKNEELDSVLMRYIQAPWYGDYRDACAVADDGDSKVEGYATAYSVINEYLLPLAAVSPLLGFIPDETTRDYAVGVAGVVGFVFAATAKWTKYEEKRQRDRGNRVNEFLTEIRAEIFKDARVKSRFGALSDARIEAALTRILAREIESV